MQSYAAFVYYQKKDHIYVELVVKDLHERFLLNITCFYTLEINLIAVKLAENRLQRNIISKDIFPPILDIVHINVEYVQNHLIRKVVLQGICLFTLEKTFTRKVALHVMISSHWK